MGIEHIYGNSLRLENLLSDIQKIANVKLKQTYLKTKRADKGCIVHNKRIYSTRNEKNTIVYHRFNTCTFP